MDIKLYSGSIKDYIKKIANGEFEVSIPLTSDMNKNNLVIYYLNEDGTVETHPVKIDGDYAKFTTNHFSTYTLASKDDTKNPETLDNINIYILSGGIALITLLGCAYILKKKED